MESIQYGEIGCRLIVARNGRTRFAFRGKYDKISTNEELWETNLQGKDLRICIEATMGEKLKNRLELKNIPYINSRVLWINLKQRRKREIGVRTLKYYKDNNGKLVADDRNSIKCALKDEIYYLNFKYNFYNIYLYYSYGILKKLMKNTKYYSTEVV